MKQELQNLLKHSPMVANTHSSEGISVSNGNACNNGNNGTCTISGDGNTTITVTGAPTQAINITSGTIQSFDNSGTLKSLEIRGMGGMGARVQNFKNSGTISTIATGNKGAIVDNFTNTGLIIGGAGVDIRISNSGGTINNTGTFTSQNMIIKSESSNAGSLTFTNSGSISSNVQIGRTGSGSHTLKASITNEKSTSNHCTSVIIKFFNINTLHLLINNRLSIPISHTTYTPFKITLIIKAIFNRTQNCSCISNST